MPSERFCRNYGGTFPLSSIHRICASLKLDLRKGRISVLQRIEPKNFERYFRLKIAYK